MDALNIEPLSQEEVDNLWDELQHNWPFASNVPWRWSSWTVRPVDIALTENWEWNATYIMFVLAANDALDIPE